MLYDIGTICVKIAGRDAGKTCVVIDTLDEQYVLIDGQTRRRKCNMLHLEPLNERLSIQKGATSEAVKKAFEAKGISCTLTTPKKAKPKPTKSAKQSVDASSTPTKKEKGKVSVKKA